MRQSSVLTAETIETPRRTERTKFKELRRSNVQVAQWQANTTRAETFCVSSRELSQGGIR